MTNTRIVLVVVDCDNKIIKRTRAAFTLYTVCQERAMKSATTGLDTMWNTTGSKHWTEEDIVGAIGKLPEAVVMAYKSPPPFLVKKKAPM